ncbi:uncharacterized protein LOC130699686 [Daphnia carinata]|uniref:uncharacterized protein LOC130699686 n=1 Tax=Daphnia carinata TaxID=120202 RepID=UPI00257F1162|nr:uncharacterized protein LOC130699686 [Daphnia carinata]
MDTKDSLRLQMGQCARNSKIEVEEVTENLKASFRAVELNLQWQVENVRKGVGVFSGMMNSHRFPQTFQFGLRYIADVAVVSLMIMNFHYLGLRVALVRLTYNNGKPVWMKRKTSERRANKLDLFVQEFCQGLEEDSGFSCQVYVEGLVDTYMYEQYDGLLTDQLWDSARFCCWTDFKFFVRGNVFNAHKFVLSARSSRLARDISRVDSIRLNDDWDPDTFKCFLHFLYTGNLLLEKWKANAKQLLSLAEEYELNTLTQLCKNDLTKLNESNFPECFLSTGPPAVGPPSIDLDLKPKSKICSKPDSAEIRFNWDISRLPQDYIVRAVDFHHQEAFHVCFRSGGHSEEGRRNHALFIFSKQWPEGGFEVVAVNVVISEKSSNNGRPSKSKLLAANKWVKMVGLNPALAVFSVDLECLLLQIPFNILFSIELSSENAGHYSYQPRDIHLAENLWSAAFGADLTDAEISVEGRIFRVHRALMAARSLFFRELLSSENMKESCLKRIVLEEIDSSIFEEVLYFMYTGSLRVSAGDARLLVAAEKYQIETLRILCENQVKRHDRSLEDLCSFLQMIA